MEPLANEELKPCNLVPGKMEETEIEMQVRNMSGMLTCSNVFFKKACSLLSCCLTFIQILPYDRVADNKSVKVKSQQFSLFVNSNRNAFTIFVCFICCVQKGRFTKMEESVAKCWTGGQRCDLSSQSIFGQVRLGSWLFNAYASIVPLNQAHTSFFLHLTYKSKTKRELNGSLNLVGL